MQVADGIIRPPIPNGNGQLEQRLFSISQTYRIQPLRVRQFFRECRNMRAAANRENIRTRPLYLPYKLFGRGEGRCYRGHGDETDIPFPNHFQAVLCVFLFPVIAEPGVKTIPFQISGKERYPQGDPGVSGTISVGVHE